MTDKDKPFATRIRELISSMDYGVIVTETELERRMLNIVEDELKSKGCSPVIEQQRKIVRGREDARMGGLIFEFKKPSKDDQIENLKSEKPQIDKYIDEYQSQGIVLRGILTNGYKILFVNENKEIVEGGDLTECVWMLETWVSALAMKIASASDLKNSLGPISAIGKGFIKELYDAYSEYSEITLIKESFEMWDGVYGCATNLNEETVKAVKRFAKNSLDLIVETRMQVKLLLFIIETYLSVLMKLLVAEVAKQKSIAPVTSLEELLGDDFINGYAKLSERIPFLSRLFEYDTFFWFVDLANRNPSIAKTISQYLANMITVLSNMDFTAVSTDLIKQAYQDFFDSSTRRALGEFYTPDTLVDEILDSVGYCGDKIDNQILLDPACGSGTFLVKAINRFLVSTKSNGVSKEAALEKVVKRIIGVDIHPFAVAMAKVNYLLALGRLIDPTVRKTIRDLPIPIYWADSLATRSKKAEFGTGGQITTVEVRVPVLGTFVLPDPAKLEWGKVIDASLHALNANWSDNRFLEEFTEESRLMFKRVLLNFLQIFRERRAKGMNGRWLSTLRNFIVIDQLKERCDFVVGNPPWVRIHNINKDIRNELIGKFEVYKRDKKGGNVVGWKPKLRATKVPFPQQIDYCMAFVESGIDYLKEDGKLGFVISSKITSVLYANLLRKFLLRNTLVEKAYDHSISNERFFEGATNSPLVLVVRKHKPDENNADFIFDAFENMQWTTKQRNIPLNRGDLESPWCLAPPEIVSTFTKMREGNPRLGDVHTVHMGVKTSLNRIFLVESLSHTATKGIITIINERKQKANLEANLLNPVLKGRDVEAWRFRPHEYIVWTHDDEGKPLKRLPRDAEDYFSKHKKRLMTRTDYRKGQPYWMIFRVTKEKLGQKVAWQELSKMMESVVLEPRISDETLGDRLLITLQTIYFVATDDEDLNYGLVALLNSTPVRAFISSFSMREMGQPPRFRHISWTVGLVPLPLDFIKKRKSTLLKNLIGASRRMHRSRGADATLARILDRQVARLYGLSDRELGKLNEYLHNLGVPTIHEI